MSHYRLDQLGWLQFERLCALVLEAETGEAASGWRGHADRWRVALSEGPLVLERLRVALPEPVTVAVVWVPEAPAGAERLRSFCRRVCAFSEEERITTGVRVLLLTNLGREAALSALAAAPLPWVERAAVLGARELSESLDRRAAIRAAMPSVLGLRDLGPLVDASARARSSLDLAGAQALARVFVPTGAYERTRQVLQRHRFAVLTGPPEMGKTAIAQMIALAQLTDGWDAHECITPEQVWRVFDGGRAQVFVADDAFGSTEYRPDAAERWARDMERLLRALDPRHWLIWTSRPAPLRAGLRRVQRERGAERFPAPAEVLVDAGHLDLAEKTLILFRHAKTHHLGSATAGLVRGTGLQIVQHPHFTPERIRRFATGRLETLAAGGRPSRREMAELVERELAMPTEAMATSFRALGPEHRRLLIALLDAPAGSVDERDLAAALRRHGTAGLSRPPGELIDRLTDHFLRVTPHGIGWVHPSWRDLVIGELRTDPHARHHFLGACGPHGAMLALSCAGGVAGERTLPLLVTDADWDLLTDRIGQLLRESDDQDIARLLLTLVGVLGADVGRSARGEAQALARFALARIRRSWDALGRPLPLFLLEAWYAANDRLSERERPPRLAPTWAAVRPTLPLDHEQGDLARVEEWLALVETLRRHEPQALAALGFPREDADLLDQLARDVPALLHTPDRDRLALTERVLGQLQRVVPRYAGLVGLAMAATRGGDRPVDRWWVPEDLAAPPTSEPVSAPTHFTPEQVDRVLSDL